jgi:LmbE family N-acetylglucosaminyl deacetylase
VAHREQLGFPNRRLFDGFEVRVALAKVFRRFRPRLVLGLGDKTPLASPDHAQAVAITEAAVFYSRLTKWDDTFDGLPVHTVPNLLSYFLFAGVADLPAATGRWWSIFTGFSTASWRPFAAMPRSFPRKKPIFIRGSRRWPAPWG